MDLEAQQSIGEAMSRDAAARAHEKPVADLEARVKLLESGLNQLAKMLLDMRKYTREDIAEIRNMLGLSATNT